MLANWLLYLPVNVEPLRVKVERVPRAMTLDQFNQQYPSKVSVEELAVINNVERNTQLRSGQMIKRVIQ